MATYINMRHDGEVETVDEFETRKEARKMCAEYNSCDRYHEYYVSSRSTKDWREGD